ncbi:choice-of-anchor L domain-containing protein [Winogradskyella psychrotolerans]|uniref:choice-of-anchor L domain-containing protein n=1 Tax=Winogradskyella psychrotolerans TaxID=1344585 RepID=UPI001C07762C|nr:choice-of-anchor L domain-containing protein [Winogradskyella psychrotolerans]MBU2927025.1 choice-of-anchor L domain-containing protein [Winogradskyella psychrotolerans]
MKNITLFFIVFGFFLTAQAQYNFSPITGPTNVIAGTPVIINLNDLANTSNVPVSSTGSYNSFLITVNWVQRNGNPWSNDAQLTVLTTAGAIDFLDPSNGGANNGDATTLTYTGELAGLYNPTNDGYLDLVLNQEYAGSDANWYNIEITLFESPICPDPSNMSATSITFDSVVLDWAAGNAETAWNIEYSAGSNFFPGLGLQDVAISPNGTPNTTLTSLASATNYYLYYQADCGSGDLSSWVGPYMFSTECNVFTAPYTEGFENEGIIPLCWTMDGGEDWFFSEVTGNNNIGNAGVITGNTATNGYFAWCDASGNDGERTLTSPFVDVSGLSTPALYFYEISHNQGGQNAVLDVEVWDGAVWNNMATYNSNTVGWEHKIIDISGLTITGNVQARFIFSETSAGGNTDDISIDDVSFDEAPSCFPPTALTSENLSLTSTEIAWQDDPSVTEWNIEYGVSGFNSGTSEGTIVNVTTNPYILTDLIPDAYYEFYVQSVCDTDEESIFTGPFEFYTGYCVSMPSSITLSGVNYVNLQNVMFPTLGDVTYENHTTPVVDVFQGVNTSIEIQFGHASTYDANVWIDFNDDLVFDDTELLFQGESPGGDLQVLDASFMMSETATLGEHRMRIGTANFGQVVPSPCYVGPFGVTLDFTVNVQELLCTLPEAGYTIIPDCENTQFYIDVNVTSLGDATSLEISNTLDTNTVQALNAGDFQVGPFSFGSTVQVFVMNEQDNNCMINSTSYTVSSCPPVNDNCENATVATVNTGNDCLEVTSGTISEATPSNVPVGSCSGNPNDDVWFQFVATDDTHLITLENIDGAFDNLDHGLYEGACDNFIEIYCSADTSIVTPTLVVGNTYYIRVFSSEASGLNTTFDLCIRPGIANVIVDQTTYTVEQLVEDVLIGGECAQISNITYSTGTNFGDENGIGYFSFDGDGVSFPFEEGLVLTTGNAAASSGPNTEALADGSLAWPGDEDLESAIGITNTYNATVLEFDFIPFKDQISFDFLMASEEYTGGSFECNFSDAFAFLLTDANGITSNLAVIPNTTTPISVTNIHQENFSCEAVNETYFGEYIPTNLPPIAFDGRTTVFTAESLVNIGETYHIKMVITDYNDAVFDSGVYLKAGSFDLGELDLGADITIDSGDATCLGAPVILDTQAPTLEHIWFKNGIEIEGETSSTITITEPDLYTALVVFSNQCILTDDILVEFLQPPLINGSPSNLEGCSSNGEAPFTLTDNDSVILDTLDPSNYTISYHLSENDAENDINSITADPYINISNPQTIYVRVEDNTTSCNIITTFDLIVTAPAHTADVIDYVECGNGVEATFNLADFSAEVLNGQDASQFVVSYHILESEAISDTNPLPDSYTTSGETVYVRVESINYEDCYVINSFELIVGTQPLVIFDPQYQYEVCPSANESIEIGLIANNFSVDDVIITWYYEGVLIDGENELVLDNGVVYAGEYLAEVEFIDTGCVNTIMQEVIELGSCIFPEGISPGVTPGQNDTFDLSSFSVTKLEIFNRYGALVYSKNNYTNEWHGQTNDGDELPVGTYFYTVVYEGGAKTKSAWVYINK